MRSIALATHTQSSAAEIVRGSSIMNVINCRNTARNRSSMPRSSLMIEAAATASIRANASSARRNIDADGLTRVLDVRNAVKPRLIALLEQPLDGAGNLARLVADPLQIGDHLGNAGNHAQIAGRGLAARDHVVDHLINVHFEFVDPPVGVDRLLRKLLVGRFERVECRAHLRLDQSTHLQYARAYRLEFFVVFLY